MTPLSARVRVEAFIQRDELLLEMNARAVRQRSLRIGVPAAAVLSVVLLALPGSVAAAPTYSKTLVAPWLFRDSSWVTTGRGCYGYVGPGSALNLTTGAINDHVAVNVSRCPKTTSLFDEVDSFGVWGNNFTITKAANYTVSAVYQGSVWVNLTARPWGGPSGQVFAYYVIWSSIYIWSPSQNHYVAYSLHYIAETLIHSGKISTRFRISGGNVTAYLKPGNYQVATGFTPEVDVQANRTASHLATATASVASSSTAALLEERVT